MRLSNAKVLVSSRLDMKEESGGNRTVTITGSPGSAQTAHLLITHKLESVCFIMRFFDIFFHIFVVVKFRRKSNAPK
jgi:hypothetical protein